MKWLVLVCLVASAVAAPSTAPDDVEEYKAFLLKAKPTNGTGPTLEQVMAERPWSGPEENSGKYEGDIVLTDQQIEEMVAAYSGEGNRNGVINSARRWPSNTIIYEFAAGHWNADQIRTIEASFNMFHTRTCIRFRRRTNQSDFVRITRFADGCYAHVGYWRNFGAHTYNLAWPGCSNPMIIIHEWLHVVGFEHMHQTHNRDSHVTIHLANVINGFAFAFTRYTTSYISLFSLPYELDSNLHYGRRAFSSNNRDTIVPRTNDNGNMGQRRYVTNIDVRRVNRLYNCPSGQSLEVRAEDISTPAYTIEDYLKDLEEMKKADEAQ